MQIVVLEDLCKLHITLYKNFCNFSWSVQLSADCLDFIICTVQKGRSSSKWVARPIFEAKNYSWKFDLMAKVTVEVSTLLYTLILNRYRNHTPQKLIFLGSGKMQNIFRCERQHQVGRCLMSDPPTRKSRRQLCAQCVLNSR